MTRTLLQPPPDEVLERDPPEGFRWAVEPDPDWRLATEHERASRKCRRPGCQRPPSAAMRRTHHYESGRRGVWWFYCSWHLYGRKLVDGAVVRRVLRPLDS